MIELDGGEKSGSGTLLRHAVALATLQHEELYIYNIRAQRDKPGLRHQHRQAVLACRDICDGEVEGAEIGAMKLNYKPGKRIKGGCYRWDIGSGGSTTMLAMTVLPLALFAEQPSVFEICGGVFQDFAPSAYHMKYVLLPTLTNMGIKASLEVKRPGYAEQGGGIIEVKVEPVKDKVIPLRLIKQGKLNKISGIALSSHLSKNRVSQRMANACLSALKKEGFSAHIEIIDDKTSLHEGAALAIWASTGECIIGADRAGKKGRRAEAIGEYVAYHLAHDLASGATTDRYLADQLILYAALAEGASQYLIPELTEHIAANLWLVEQFLSKGGAKTKLDDNSLIIQGIMYMGA